MQQPDLDTLSRSIILLPSPVTSEETTHAVYQDLGQELARVGKWEQLRHKIRAATLRAESAALLLSFGARGDGVGRDAA